MHWYPQGASSKWFTDEGPASTRVRVTDTATASVPVIAARTKAQDSRSKQWCLHHHK